MKKLDKQIKRLGGKNTKYAEQMAQCQKKLEEQPKLKQATEIRAQDSETNNLMRPKDLQEVYSYAEKITTIFRARICLLACYNC